MSREQRGPEQYSVGDRDEGLLNEIWSRCVVLPSRVARMMKNDGVEHWTADADFCRVEYTIVP